MAAPDNAIPLRKESHAWDQGPNKKTKVECLDCNWHGFLPDLLCTPDTSTLWCPQCRNAGWMYS